MHPLLFRTKDANRFLHILPSSHPHRPGSSLCLHPLPVHHRSRILYVVTPSSPAPSTSQPPLSLGFAIRGRENPAPSPELTAYKGYIAHPKLLIELHHPRKIAISRCCLYLLPAPPRSCYLFVSKLKIYKNWWSILPSARVQVSQLQFVRFKHIHYSFLYFTISLSSHSPHNDAFLVALLSYACS